VAQTLKEKGFIGVRVLDGGLKGWMEAGLPTQKAS
jgi:rhodanese-related sulfurtransferase